MTRRISVSGVWTIDLRPSDLNEYDQGQYSCEASSVGLRPMEWPPFIAAAGLDGRPTTLWFDMLEDDWRDGDLVAVSYVNKLTGATITIRND